MNSTRSKGSGQARSRDSNDKERKSNIEEESQATSAAKKDLTKPDAGTPTKPEALKSKSPRPAPPQETSKNGPTSPSENIVHSMPDKNSKNQNTIKAKTPGLPKLKEPEASGSLPHSKPKDGFQPATGNTEVPDQRPNEKQKGRSEAAPSQSS